MATEFTYSITSDFPNSIVNLAVLQAEINANLIAPARTVEGIEASGDDVTIEFDDDLTAGQETSLNGIVAAHQGEGFVEVTQALYEEAEQTTSMTTYQEAAALDSGILKAGKYRLHWYAETSLAAVVATGRAVVRVMWNGSERGTDSNASDFYTSFSGTVIVDVDDLDAPTLSIEYRMAGTSATARVRRCRLFIEPLPADELEEE